jgi:imidazolonepropionase-like amidohydrolase
MSPRQLFLALAFAVVPADFAAATVYLTADTLIDVESGKTVTSPALVIEDGRIVRAGTQGRLAVPTGAERLALTGMTILPGLVDMHTHLTGAPRIQGYSRLKYSVPRRAIKGVRNAEATLLAGVTTVRDVGAPGYADVALRDAIREGDVIGPRMFVSGPSLGITGGHCTAGGTLNLLPPGFTGPDDGVADGPWAARQAVRRNIRFGVDLIKYCATGGVMSKGTKVGEQQYSQEEMRAIVEEAHQRGLLVASHAHGTEGIRAAILAGTDTIEHASFLDDELIALAKKHGTVLVMDIYLTDYLLAEGEKNGVLPESLEKERLTGERQRESFRRAVSEGVKVLFGTDASIYPHGDNPRQLAVMVAHGMTPLQALQAATIEPARVLNREADFGSLREGRYADIIAVAGDPLADISLLESVTFVMKEGVVYKRPD